MNKFFLVVLAACLAFACAQTPGMEPEPEPECAYSTCSECFDDEACCWVENACHFNPNFEEVNASCPVTTCPGDLCATYESCESCLNDAYCYWNNGDNCNKTASSPGTCYDVCRAEPRICGSFGVCKTDATNTSAYTCICKPGYTEANGTCVDVDECAVGTDACTDICVDGLAPAGSYTCGCNGTRILNKDKVTCVAPPTPTCGNGLRNTGEDCDGGLGCFSCKCSSAFGYTASANTSDPRCVEDVPEPACGDFIRNGDDECDGGIGCASDCKCKLGYEQVPSGPDCQKVFVSGCGDGFVKGTEECDSTLGCTEACRCAPNYRHVAETGTCRPVSVCGNGKLDLLAGEECDSKQVGCFGCRCDRENNYVPTSPPSLKCRLVEVVVPGPCDAVPGAVQDLCGECKLPTDSDYNDCLGCDNVPNSGKLIDACGVCRFPKANNSAGTDPNFATSSDECDACAVPGEAKDICGQCLFPTDARWESCVGCDGVAFSGARLDKCGQCRKPSDEDFNKCDSVGCDGVVGSNTTLDTCSPAKCLNEADPNFNVCTPEVPIYDIRPIVLCWASTPSNDGNSSRYVAYLGSRNLMNESVYLPPGPRNQFTFGVNSPAAEIVTRAGQPEFFPTDLSAAFPQAPSIVWDGSVFEWTLGNHKIVFDINGTRERLAECPADVTMQLLAYMERETLAKKRAAGNSIEATVIQTVRTSVARAAGVSTSRVTVTAVETGTTTATGETEYAMKVTIAESEDSDRSASQAFNELTNPVGENGDVLDAIFTANGITGDSERQYTQPNAILEGNDLAEFDIASEQTETATTIETPIEEPVPTPTPTPRPASTAATATLGATLLVVSLSLLF